MKLRITVLSTLVTLLVMPAVAEARQPDYPTRKCAAVRVSGTYVTLTAFSVQSTRYYGGRRAPSCALTRQVAKDFLRERYRTPRSRCNQPLVDGASCTVRVRRSGTWDCSRRGVRYPVRVECGRNRNTAVRFNLRDRAH